ncbi:hypothetical protein Tco_1245708, partial [Tanacetum coccineum]
GINKKALKLQFSSVSAEASGFESMFSIPSSTINLLKVDCPFPDGCGCVVAVCGGGWGLGLQLRDESEGGSMGLAVVKLRLVFGGYVASVAFCGVRLLRLVSFANAYFRPVGTLGLSWGVLWYVVGVVELGMKDWLGLRWDLLKGVKWDCGSGVDRSLLGINKKALKLQFSSVSAEASGFESMFSIPSSPINLLKVGSSRGLVKISSS